MNHCKKSEIQKMSNVELVDAFENSVSDMTKAINFSKKGITVKMQFRFDHIKKELLARMKDGVQNG